MVIFFRFNNWFFSNFKLSLIKLYKKFIIGKNRSQISLFVASLDEAIDPYNEVRLIDLVVSSISLSELGVKTDFIENGRPAYHPSVLLRLFICGYYSIPKSKNRFIYHFYNSLKLLKKCYFYLIRWLN